MQSHTLVPFPRYSCCTPCLWAVLFLFHYTHIACLLRISGLLVQPSLFSSHFRNKMDFIIKAMSSPSSPNRFWPFTETVFRLFAVWIFSVTSLKRQWYEKGLLLGTLCIHDEVVSWGWKEPPKKQQYSVCSSQALGWCWRIFQWEKKGVRNEERRRALQRTREGSTAQTAWAQELAYFCGL